jgi:hypothetical protein
MSLNLKEQLLNVDVERTWTDETMKMWPPVVLNFVATYNGAASHRTEKINKQLGTGKITPADRAAAQRLAASSSTRTTLHYRGEAHLKDAGGSLYYTPTTVSYTPLNGQEKTKPNAAIPTRFDETETYENVQQVAAFCSHLVTVDQGAWKPNYNAAAWGVALSHSFYSAASLATISSSICLILQNDRVWTQMGTTVRASITSVEQLLFVRQCLDRLDRHYYDLLNSRIVFRFLQAFKEENGSWYQTLTGDGKPTVDGTVYRRKSDSPPEAIDLVTRDGLPCVMWYYGGVHPRMQFPESDGTLKGALARTQKMQHLVGSDDSASSILAHMRGYSGLTDDFGKRIQFTLAATIGAWFEGRIVDIILYSVGDIIPLHSSLNKWHASVQNEGNPLKSVFPARDSFPVKYLVPIMDVSKIPDALKSQCIHTLRKQSVAVLYSMNTLPNAKDKKTAIDYESAAQGILADVFHDHDFIAYGPIFGECCFSGTHKKVEKQFTAVDIPKTSAWLRPVYTYLFGSAAKWRGVLSTFPKLQLAGYGAQRQGGSWNMKEKLLHTFAIQQVATPTEWYNKVGEDALGACVAWLNPVTRFSPISNLPFVSKAGVTLILSQFRDDDGDLIANVARQNMKSTALGFRLDVEPRSSSANPASSNSSNSSASFNPFEVNKTSAPVQGGNTQDTVVSPSPFANIALAPPRGSALDIPLEPFNRPRFIQNQLVGENPKTPLMSEHEQLQYTEYSSPSEPPAHFEMPNADDL